VEEPAAVLPRLSLKGDTTEREWRHRTGRGEQQAGGSGQRAGDAKRQARSAQRKALSVVHQEAERYALCASRGGEEQQAAGRGEEAIGRLVNWGKPDGEKQAVFSCQRSAVSFRPNQDRAGGGKATWRVKDRLDQLILRRIVSWLRRARGGRW